MNGEQKFWLGFWAIAGITLCVLSVLIYASQKHEDDVIQRMVIEKGYSPIEAGCAFNANNAICVNLTAKGDK